MLFILEDMTRRDVCRTLIRRLDVEAAHFHIAGNETYTAIKVRSIIRDVGGLQ